MCLRLGAGRPGCDLGAGGGSAGSPAYRLTIRNQLSKLSFAQSIEEVAEPGTKEGVLGAYYPHGSYMTTQEFEARWCGGASA